MSVSGAEKRMPTPNKSARNLAVDYYSFFALKHDKITNKTRRVQKVVESHKNCSLKHISYMLKKNTNATFFTHKKGPDNRPS